MVPSTNFYVNQAAKNNCPHSLDVASVAPLPKSGARRASANAGLSLAQIVWGSHADVTPNKRHRRGAANCRMIDRSSCQGR